MNNNIKIQTIEETEYSELLLREVKNKLGFVPNLFKVISSSNVGLKAFIELNDQFANSSFNATERELIQTTISVANECGYCVAGHSKFAEIQGVSNEVIHAIRNNNTIKDRKLQALNKFTLSLLNKRGKIHPGEINEFLKAGYNSENVIEAILGISLKTFSNLTNNLFDIPLDNVFKDHIWFPETDNQSINRKAI